MFKAIIPTILRVSSPVHNNKTRSVPRRACTVELNIDTPACYYPITIMAMALAKIRNVNHVEDAPPTNDNIIKSDEIHESIDPEEEKRLVRKIDWIILPCLSVCYIFFYVSSRQF
jgi:hypothetical protein